MSLLWEERSPNEPQPHRREPEPEPTRQQQRRLSPTGLLAIQQGAGNHAATAMLSRFKDRSDLGKDLVEFDESEPQPKMMKLASDPGFQYQARFGLGDRIYERTPKGASFQLAKVDPLEKEKRDREQLKGKLAIAQSRLFDESFGGGKEGTFEYVANYLYDEVFSVSKEEAQKIWDRVYTVEDKPLTAPTLKRKEIHGKRKLLSDMIDIGLDANWKKVPVQELVKTTVEGGAMPGKDMQTTVWTDYLAASDDGTTKPMKTLGVGFHTTDGPPGAVAKAKKDGGWGGVTRPMTVDFFRTRYALDQTGWNPLGAWLAKAGPTFRKGIKDNELLSTVSVATATHGSVRFPLADRKRKHVTEKNKDDKDAFKMEVYMYAVVVREGYATFASQGTNAFGEIATGDIPVEDIIGWTKITRWHDYEDVGQTVPATADFYYEMTQLQRNDKFTAGELNDRVFGIANGEIEKERVLSAKKYTAAT